MSESPNTAADRRPSATATSLDKKRARDRRAQRNARERREKQTKDYEAQLDYCKRYHGGPSADGQQAAQAPAFEELQRLSEQQNQIVEFVKSMQQNIEGLLCSLQGNALPLPSANDSAIEIDDLMHMPATISPQQSQSPRITRWPQPGSLNSSSLVTDATPSQQSRRWKVADMLCPTDLSTASRVARDIVDAVPLLPLRNSEPTAQHSLAASSAYPDDSTTIIDLECNNDPYRLTNAYGEVPSHASSHWASDGSAMRPTSVRSHSFVSSRSAVPSFSPNDITPRWARTPTNIDPHLEDISIPCFNTPEIVIAAPDLPDPLGLLFGSRKNPLANTIHGQMRRYRVSEPERLAMGWLIYVYLKWVFAPTRERYERLPAFYRPTDRQLEREHPPQCDICVWPVVRHHLMEEYGKPGWHETLIMLSCCIKLRWPWGQEILEPGEDDGLRMRDDFVHTFTSIDGWGLTPEFIQQHPQWVVGLDLERVTYTIS